MSYAFMRKPGTRSNGGSFDEATKNAIWTKGQAVVGYDPNYVRRDRCGAFMERSEYGNRSSRFGWEVDHMKPAAMGGTDDLTNLQPLNWQNNAYKSDNYPNWQCSIRS